MRARRFRGLRTVAMIALVASGTYLMVRDRATTRRLRQRLGAALEPASPVQIATGLVGLARRLLGEALRNLGEIVEGPRTVFDRRFGRAQLSEELVARALLENDSGLDYEIDGHVVYLSGDAADPESLERTRAAVRALPGVDAVVNLAVVQGGAAG